MVLATQQGVDRPVAIKLLHAEHVADVEQVRRCCDEARVTASLAHPNVVRVLDFDVEAGVPWIAYEYLDGETLHARLARGRLPWVEAARAAADVLAALEAAHARGVLHRDIKPQNVLSARSGEWKVADFGIAKWTGRSAVKTRTGMLVGTPEYVAPEVLAGQPAGPPADLYATGALLHELVCGAPPFRDDNLVNVLRAHLEVAPQYSFEGEPLRRTITLVADHIRSALAAETSPVGRALREALVEEWLYGTDAPALRGTGRQDARRRLVDLASALPSEASTGVAGAADWIYGKAGGLGRYAVPGSGMPPASSPTISRRPLCRAAPGTAAFATSW